MEKKELMSLDYFFKDELCTHIVIDNHLRVTVIDYTNNFFHRAFGTPTKLSANDVFDFLEGRCFPRTRANCKELLAMIDLETYSPLDICRVTHGIMSDDYFWVRFGDEPELTWDDIKEWRKKYIDL